MLAFLGPFLAMFAGVAALGGGGNGDDKAASAAATGKKDDGDAPKASVHTSETPASVDKAGGSEPEFVSVPAEIDNPEPGNPAYGNAEPENPEPGNVSEPENTNPEPGNTPAPPVSAAEDTNPEPENTEPDNPEPGNTGSEASNPEPGNPEPGNSEPGNTPPEEPEEPAEEPNVVTQPGSVPTGSNGQQDNTNGDANTSVDLGASTTVEGGRVTTIDTGFDNIQSIKVTSPPEFGNLTVNPDNTLALVLSNTTDSGPLSFSYEVTLKNGTTKSVDQTVNVEQQIQLSGWATGDNYMLEVDDNGDLIVEHGDVHRTVHLSNSKDALTKADIAAREGLQEKDIDQDWLLDHPEYGATPEMALAYEPGIQLWYGLIGEGSEPGSHHLLFEKGYSYDNGRFIQAGTEGESEMHPIYVGSYGDGDRPIMENELRIYQAASKNVVIDGLEFEDGIMVLNGENILFNDLVLTDQGMNLQKSDGITVRDSALYEITKDEPTGKETWWQLDDRISGIFATKNDGLLIEGTFVDKVGWEDDYDYNRDADAGQPPSMYSQNVYIQRDNTEVTFRDNVSMRAASFGAQVRSGGFIEDNVFIDNNAGLNFLGGDVEKDGDRTGHFTLATDNVVTSGASKRVDLHEGARTLGINDAGDLSTLNDNIVTHLANPDDPDELAEKKSTHAAVAGGSKAYYNDTIVYNWVAGNDDVDHKNFRSPDTNVDGLDTGILDDTTIQNFAAELLGDSDATIEDLAEYLRAQANGDFDDLVDADVIIAYFQKGFGIDEDVRTSATTLRFVPNDLGDGIRWDNRLNWDTQDLPGQIDGDSVDLGGNWVQFSGTTTVDDLDFGSGGKIEVNYGKLSVEGAVSVGDAGAQVIIEGPGQFWIDGYRDNDTLDIDVVGGRFANEGTVTGTLDLTVTTGQAILASGGDTMELSEDSQITIVGSDNKVGFDGDRGGQATLELEDGAVLRFEADDDGFGSISEMRSGAFGDSPNVQSGLDLGVGTLELDVSGLGSQAYSGTLMSADQMVGVFDKIDVSGLGGGRDGTLIFDYNTDELRIELGAAGKGDGDFTVQTIGDMDNAKSASALWQALTDGKGTYNDDTRYDLVVDDDEVGMDLLPAA